MTDTAGSSLRLFLGLWPPAALLPALQVHAQSWAWPTAARRTAPERLHVTLHFLGLVPQARLAQLRTALEVAWEGCELALDRAQLWPGGIAVLEATSVPAELARLHAALGDRLRALQIPVEHRRFRPHVTLARKAAGARPPAGFPPLRWRAGPPYLLVQSLPNAGGYLPLQRFG